MEHKELRLDLFFVKDTGERTKKREISERSCCKDQPLAKAAARELDKKKTRPDRVRILQDTSVTRRKTVPDSSRPSQLATPIRSQLASSRTCATRGSSDFGGPVQPYKIKDVNLYLTMINVENTTDLNTLSFFVNLFLGTIAVSPHQNLPQHH
ncbi:hypothetical protein DY000_02063494 [Brassica cretica]|uniref:Uncharacterized protein n=1 Tax=Brassica cretica TaxID=69181 RepID=A0ABQ7B282_BRACR|nr:hypothetical protein DY000_02063494 [Brassica cretica]